MQFYEVLYADQDLMALYKPAGIPCQSKITDPLPLDLAAQQLFGEPLQLIHRIDQPVSGLVLFRRPHSSLTIEQWQQHIGAKQYLALVEGKVEKDEALVTHYLKRDGRRKKSVLDPKDGKLAQLSFNILHHFDRYTLLDVRLHTGRFHQIRAQLSTLGHPIKGDVKYGARRKNKDRSIDLHCFKYTIGSNTPSPFHIFAPIYSYTGLWPEIHHILKLDKNYDTG